MSKLTPRTDNRKVAGAKRHGKQRRVSVSEIVEKQPSLSARDAPILRSLRGSLKKADVDSHKRRLAIKYR